MMPSAAIEVTVTNENGLHARPAMSFVDLACKFSSEIKVTRLGNEPETVDGKSIMQMLTLAAIHGTTLKIEAEGDDAQTAVERLGRLFEEGFKEE